MQTELQTKDLTWVPMKGLKITKALWVIITIIITSSQLLNSQSKNILFYNVENLFDIKDDSLKLDEEFTPNGNRHWNYNKYQQKLKNIARVIYESDGFNTPLIIGLCEVENKKVLQDLLYQTGLINLGYKPILYESDDRRGIDVAILYKSDEFNISYSEAIPITFNENTRPTRDILHVHGTMKDSVKLHLFINHWPSRYGGVMQTHHKRIQSAQTLSETINSVTANSPEANIIVTGDFNDNPKDSSLLLLCEKSNLVNLSKSKNIGSLKHKHAWYLFDQFLVSKNLVEYSKFSILSPKYLLEEDTNYSGYKPNRTYLGFKYQGGYSDHLPIVLKINLEQ